MSLDIKNPTVLQYGHPNFGGAKIEVSTNVDPSGNGLMNLKVVAPDGRVGNAQLQPQDNGNLVVRIHLDPANPIHVLILDGTGVILEA